MGWNIQAGGLAPKEESLEHPNHRLGIVVTRGFILSAKKNTTQYERLGGDETDSQYVV